MKNENKDLLLDVKGTVTGFEANLKSILWLVAAAVVPLIFYFAGPSIGLGSNMAGLMFGWIFCAIILWLSNMFDPGAVIMFFAFGGMFLGLFDYGDLTGSMASSMFLPITGFFIVAFGADTTPVSKRLAYYLLKILGKNQSLIVFVLALTTVILSAFCSNFASTVVIAATAIGIIKEVEAVSPEDGKKLGKAIMMVLPTAACIGGIALLSGSPVTNGMAISTIEAASDGAISITFAQWAKFGVPVAIVAVFPLWLIYSWVSGVKSKPVNVDKAYFDEKLKELGPIGGSEIRWTVIMLGMVISMICGVPMTKAPLYCAILCMCPFIGVIRPSEAIKRLPISLLITFLFTSLFATGFNKYGISEWLITIVGPFISDLPIVILMLVVTLFISLLANIFINTSAHTVIVFTILTPIVVASGMNPLVVLMPPALASSVGTSLYNQAINLCTAHYGYFNPNDTVKPGALNSLVLSVLAVLVTLIVTFITGGSLYL